MKEMQPESIQFNGEGLTKPTGHSTLDVRGNIFMPEPGNGDLPPKQSEPEPVAPPQAEIPQNQSKRQVTPEMVQRARGIWEELNAGRVLSVDERRVQEMMIVEGVSPVAGGAEAVRLTDYLDPTLQNIAQELNAEVNRVGVGNLLDPIYIQEQRARVRNLLDQGLANPDQANRLLGELNSWMAEAQGAARAEQRGGRDEINIFLEAAGEILSDGEFRRIMISDDPDFDSLPQLEEFIKKYLDPGDHNGKIVHFARSILSEDNGFSKISKKVLFERLLEKILSMADETPDSPYSDFVGNIYVSSNLQGLLEAARSYLPDDFAYFGKLRNVREVAHELNRNLKYGESYKKYVTESLRTGGLNFMHNSVAGVSAVIREYERASTHKVRQVKNWFSEKEVKAIDNEVKAMIADTKKDMKTEDGRPLTDWEISRALIIGKVLFAGSQRMAMYSGLGDLPHDALVTGRIGSVPYEYIARTLFAFKMISPRFFAGSGGSKRLMERTFDEMKTQLTEAGNKLYHLFGLDEKTILMDSLGALDSQTHSWRAELMFLGAITMNIDGERVNLLEYLNKFALKYGGKPGDPKDPILGGKGIPPEKKGDFSNDVRTAVLGQRLYLSILAKNGNFDNAMKADIWKKISLLTPSTIASIAPQAIESADEQTWEQMRHKLYAAENRRINEDALQYKKGLTEDGLVKETAAYSGVLKIAEKPVWSDTDYDSILEYMGMSDLELEGNEKKLLGKIIRTGLTEASDLAKAKLPFTFAIVDAPVVAWAKTEDGSGGLEDEDLLRILLSDQESFSKAWTEMNGLVEHPTAGLREHIAKAVEGIGMVIGRKEAQKVILPFIIAYMKMASTTRLSEWIGDFQKLSRQPTSEMERYYRNSHISWDAKEREITLEGISQDGSISDNISEGNISDLDMVKKKTKSDKGATFLRMARLIIMLLGPEAGMSFLKLFLPQDLLNSLQKK